nr:hypothetical protein [Candidatus Electrothrix aestuarii]
MTTLKRTTSLFKYTNILPYASELFGVHQPLLGWNSKRLEKRFNKGFKNDRTLLLKKLREQFSGIVDVRFDDHDNLLGDVDIQPGILKKSSLRTTGGQVVQKISSHLPPIDLYEQSVWNKVITPETIKTILQEVSVELHKNISSEIDVDKIQDIILRRNKLLEHESSLAGALLFLVEKESYDILKKIFYTSMDRTDQASALLKIISAKDSSEAFLDIENFDPTEKEQLKGVTLSPISVVHLFRQYFFELDTFLGMPESHVWLSPGSSVEIIEEHTRRNRTEKTFESTLDIFTKSETETTVQDEISDAVSEENSRNLNFGASVTATYTSISATSSFDYASSQNNAREKMHKSMREQTRKLSSEIRKNYKSTFKQWFGKFCFRLCKCCRCIQQIFIIVEFI